MSDWQPYPYQERVAEALLAGRSIILQAPTGAGKATAALLPFLHARRYLPPKAFPRKCIYSVPMRVLANQFYDEYRKVVRRFGWQQELDVRIQTGAYSEDARLEGDLIFTTIDQTLSNFLNIPYALGLGQANLNAGAVLSSYLVFDELHLFDPETTLPTTLHLLRLLRGVTPYLVMTATLSTERVKALAQELGAEAVIVAGSEAAALPSQRKTRRIHVVNAVLTGKAVVDRHRNRSIAICNTVERAQDLYDEIVRLAPPGTEVRLLHGRFLRRDRDATEDWLRREFGKDKSNWTAASAILVATQVIEVGVDITSEALHTELAPAASVVQRAGRCARYPGEFGDVFVYRLPLDRSGNPSYAPYLTAGQPRICELTWQALEKTSGQTCDYGEELRIVDEAHGEADRALIAQWQASRHYIAQRIAQTIAAQERGAAAELIRDVDSRAIIVHPDPSAVDQPWAYEAFSIYRGSLFGLFQPLADLADQVGAQWIMMTADSMPAEEDNPRAGSVWRWRPINCKDDLKGALFVAVNPALVAYSRDEGFRTAVSGDPAWQSPLPEKHQKRERFPPYQREAIVEHVGRMARCYAMGFFDQKDHRQRLPLADELAHAISRLEQQRGWQPGAIDRLIRAAIAVHDLGKLDVRWQTWAQRWQAEVSALRGRDLALPAGYLAAHTDYNDQDEQEKALAWRLRSMRPNHAVESASAAARWLLALSGNNRPLAQAALTAIMAHHSAGAHGDHGPFQAHPAAPAALIECLAAAGLAGVSTEGIAWKLEAGSELMKRRIDPEQREQLLAYMMIVRALRLADQRSQEIRG